MRQITLYKIQKQIIVTAAFTCDPVYAEQKSKEGYIVTASIHKVI